MKKITIALLGMASVVCLATSVGLISKTASAETVEQTYTVELSKTVYKVSKDDQKMLLVTAIKDFSLVYEIGYDFNGYAVGENDIAATNKYYDTLTTGGLTEDAGDIFGESWEGAKLIVWEVANTANVTFTAYAKEGVMENGYLVKPETEIKKVGDSRSNGKYTVTFVNEDGTVLATEEVYNGKTPTYEGNTPVLAETTQYTYEFKGWDKEFAPVTEDVTYTATYTATVRKYVVSFNTDGGVAIDAVEVEYGTPASALVGLTSTKTGYNFIGWTFEDGSAIPNDATVTGNITVKAAWEAMTYSAKIVRANGAEEVVEFTIENRAEKLAAIALTANDAQYTYTWAEALPSELALNNEQVFTETRTVNTYTVTFETDGGSAIEAQVVPYGTPASALANFTTSKAGYIFAGWKVLYGGNYIDIPEGATVTGDMTVKAVWKEIPVVEVATAAELAAEAAKGDVRIKLVEDIVIDTNGMFIETLSMELDLNNHTLSRSSGSSLDYPIIATIGATGVLKNGKINFAFRPEAATDHIAYIIGQNDGLVENVEVAAVVNAYWDWNNLVGLFEIGSGSGTYRNMVVNVANESGEGRNAFGVFRQVNANLTVENCIIIKNGVPFSGYNTGWGLNEQTLSDTKSATGTVLFETVDEYTASGYDTSSFSSEYWTIDETTKLPKYNVVVKAVEVSTAAELQAEVLKGSALIKLTNDIIITTSGAFIDTLNVVLDLNGYTISRYSSNPADYYIIQTIGATGVLKNGKIDFVFTPSAVTGWVTYILGTNNGLVENVEVVATVNSYWDWNNFVGLIGGGTGVYRNMVINATNASPEYLNACGIFSRVDANITVENCIIIKNNMPFTAYNTGWGYSEQALTEVKSSAGTALFGSVAEYTTSGYDTSSFSSEYWTIDETTKLPKYNATVITEMKVSNETELRVAIAKGYPTVKLMNDIIITTSGTFIDTLNVVLDLNGYTLSRSSGSSLDYPIIATISATGVLKNGKIDFAFRPEAATNHIAYIIGQNDGLVENVEVAAVVNAYWDWNNLVGLFEIGSGSGTYRNMVVNVANESGEGRNAFGVFRQVNANLTVENCIIIKNGVPFSGYNTGWGLNEQTLSDTKSATGTVLFETVDEYTASGYDTSSFSSEYWTIDETTKLPTIKR